MRSLSPGLAALGTGAMLCALSGCAGDAGKGKIVQTSATREATTLPPLKANLPELPDGAGKMDDDAPEELIATHSGLYYRILRKGGRHHPKSYDTVLAHYRGWLDDGHQFDSSYDRGKPTEFPLNGVVPGWTEGLQLIGEGGMIELEVPPRLGYGPHGKPPTIPPNAKLHFVIELVKIK
ncbi:MAG: FKBP-type peptidyl-prolyl cis-trans isomerase [Planctomycetes bacterium]|nr:FKBP-type peptidyl-prolyl cis-trans isomerase [Planctomycetota bacterium]